MVLASQLGPGMTVEVDGKIYRVESAVKMTVAKGPPFIKVRLKNLASDSLVEKNFKPQQAVTEVALLERRLEFLYPEGGGYLFLDLDSLDQVVVGAEIVSEKVSYLKEGVEVRGFVSNSEVFSVELPQFLELMVVRTENPSGPAHIGASTKTAFLETGAKIEVPLFVESGDIVKVDTQTQECVQRV